MSNPPERLPRHVAVIMDGNGRWAEKRGLPRNEGHAAGAESAGEIARCCVRIGIPYLTLYAFSTENWKRPQDEVDFLMRELKNYLKRERKNFAREGVRLVPVGRLEELPDEVRAELQRTVEATAAGERLQLNVALNYGSRAEITDACRALARRAADGEVEPEYITEDAVAAALYTAGVPDPDLLIRTGGEQRLSNYLLWQLSYAELYFTETLWPDFREDALQAALREFAARERRFGGLRQDGA